MRGRPRIVGEDSACTTSGPSRTRARNRGCLAWAHAHLRPARGARATARSRVALRLPFPARASATTGPVGDPRAIPEPTRREDSRAAQHDRGRVELGLGHGRVARAAHNPRPPPRPARDPRNARPGCGRQSRGAYEYVAVAVGPQRRQMSGQPLVIAVEKRDLFLVGRGDAGVARGPPRPGCARARSRARRTRAHGLRSGPRMHRPRRGPRRAAAAAEGRCEWPARPSRAAGTQG